MIFPSKILGKIHTTYHRMWSMPLGGWKGGLFVPPLLILFVGRVAVATNYLLRAAIPGLLLLSRLTYRFLSLCLADGPPGDTDAAGIAVDGIDRVFPGT